jgi:hypothetical protein
MGSGSGEFRLVGGLSRRLFISSVVIPVGKEPHPRRKRHLKLKLLVLPQVQETFRVNTASFRRGVVFLHIVIPLVGSLLPRESGIADSVGLGRGVPEKPISHHYSRTSL